VTRLDSHIARAVIGAGVASVLLLADRTAHTAPASAQTAITGNDFEITGEIDGLYPGQRTTLMAQVTNPQAFAIRVTSVEVSAGDAGPACTGGWLRFEPVAEPVDVAPGAVAAVPIGVELDFAAPDPCRDATWPLTFTATAVNVDGVGGPTTTSPTTTSAPIAGDEGREQATSDAGPHPSLSEQLARTGFDLAPFVVSGGLLLGAGLFARHLARRRTS
jgi:hypothetical protein